MDKSSLISKLRRVARPATGEPQERCDFCGKVIPPDHRHFVDVAAMRFVCACEMCALVQSEVGNYTPLPQRVERLDDFIMPDDLWDDFRIPVNMAFFTYRTSQEAVVAYYPAPAGATESQLKLEPWESLVSLNPSLREMAADVEALLINRLDVPGQYFIVPIDKCYQLIGLIRSSWSGLYGGVEVHHTIRDFFGKLEKEAV